MGTTMKLSKEEINKLADDLSMPWGHVVLMCDGYRITLSVERLSKGMTYRVMTYVNGCFKGVWSDPKNEAPESKFLRKSVRPNVSPAKKREYEKALGKRFVQKDSYFSGSITCYWPDWASGKAALSHLCRVCDSVQIAEPKDA
jgi:hypothetical protein